MKRLSLAAILGVSLLLGAAAIDGAEERRPNFIVIFADDLGYGDLSCYNSQVIATPRLDRMAKEGLRSGVPYVLFPTEHTGLPPGETTIAEVLKQAGYATACVGKWHLGWRKEMRPQQQGSDEFFGLLHTNDTEEWIVGQPFTQLSMFEPLQLRDGDRVVQSPVDQAMLTRRYTERSIDFIRRHREHPFFLYLAHTMPHVPQFASPAFVGKSKDGIYGDTIEELDWSTGKILDTLKELGLDENTLIVFTSDNGANLRGNKPNSKDRFPSHSLRGSNGLLRAGKGTTFEGGVRVPCIARWAGKIPAGREGSRITSVSNQQSQYLMEIEIGSDRRNHAPLRTSAFRSSPVAVAEVVHFALIALVLRATSIRPRGTAQISPVSRIAHRITQDGRHTCQ